MKKENNLLIDELIRMTDNSTRVVQSFKNLNADQLNQKLNENKWSVLECLEHLNLYGDFYLPEIEKQILSQKEKSGSLVFKSGVIGNYFANIMLVNDGKMKKMKSPKDKNPVHSKLTPMTIDRFLKQQDLLKGLLNQARNIDLKKAKCSISLTKMIKLRMGDTFRFFIYHIDRHVQQAENVLKE